MTNGSFSPASPEPERSPRLDTTVAHTARIWNYWQGGKDYFPVDREVGDRIHELFPEIVDLARTSRAFLIRAVTHLADEAGVRQFLDIGTGMPTVNNTHDVLHGGLGGAVQGAAPFACRTEGR